MKKKVLALVLALTMVLSLLPVTAMATTKIGSLSTRITADATNKTITLNLEDGKEYLLFLMDGLPAEFNADVQASTDEINTNAITFDVFSGSLNDQSIAAYNASISSDDLHVQLYNVQADTPVQRVTKQSLGTNNSFTVTGGAQAVLIEVRYSDAHPYTDPNNDRYYTGTYYITYAIHCVCIPADSAPPATDTIVSEVTVTVDWSKVPTLTAGDPVPPIRATGDEGRLGAHYLVATCNGIDFYDYGWLDLEERQYLEDGNVEKDVVYALAAQIELLPGYVFAEKAQITVNNPDAFVDYRVDNRIGVIFELGTLEDIEDAKENASGTNPDPNPNPNPNPTHTHVWDTKLTYDTTHHWKECTADGCDVVNNADKEGYAAHTHGANNLCVCGHSSTHEHKWSSKYSYVTEVHWKKCTVSGCEITDNSLKGEYEPHLFNNVGSCFCGYTSRHVHDWEDTYSYDENGHYYECVGTKGACYLGKADKEGYAAHTLDSATGECAYCAYRAPKYTVKFNANGGTGTMADQNFVYSFEQALTANTFTKTGYTFKGWVTADGTNEYADGANVKNLTDTDGANVNLYAVWEANQYTVTFDANGGNGTMANQTFVYDAAAQPLSANTFTKTGYTFMGWATTANGAVAYADNASVSNLATSGNVTLYAVWVPNTVEVGPAQGAKYFVEHYVEKWDGSYELVETEILSGEINTTVTADSTKYDDDAHHVNTAASILNGVVTFDLSAADPMSSLLTLKVYYDITPYYGSVDPTPVIPSVDVDIHDDTLSDAAKAVGAAVKSGTADITPVAGYTKESIAQMQKDNALKLVVEKKNSYDPAEKSLIDKAAQEKGKTSLVQFLEIDVTLRTMNDVIVAEVDDTIMDLTITVELNAEMQKAAKEGKTIYVARAHDGKVTFIEGTLNAEKTQFTFDSSKFSTYALVAFDSQTVTSPKTADAGIFMAVSMSILSVTGSAVLLKKKED